jgi:hypothetical protein
MGEALSQTLEPTLSPPALLPSTSIATFPIIKAEHSQTIVQPAFRGFGQTALTATKQKPTDARIFRPDAGSPMPQYIQPTTAAKGNRTQRSKPPTNVQNFRLSSRLTCVS